jgi:hypothetical protein
LAQIPNLLTMVRCWALDKEIRQKNDKYGKQGQGEKVDVFAKGIPFIPYQSNE